MEKDYGNYYNLAENAKSKEVVTEMKALLRRSFAASNLKAAR
jgi:hypothetical protein